MSLHPADRAADLAAPWSLWTSRGLRWGMGMVLGILVANAALAFVNIRRLHHSRQDVQRSYDTLLALEHLLATLLDCETAIRGYLLTGQTDYLEPYRQANSNVEAQVQRLRLLAAANAQQQRQVDQVQAQARDLMERFRSRIPEQNEERPELVELLLQLGQVKEQMDQLRLSIGQMVRQERSLLAEREAEAEASYATAVLSGLVTALLSVALAAAAYRLIGRDLEARALLTRQLRQANELLEQRVADRTVALRNANTALRTEVETRRQAEQEIRDLAQELERSNRELDQFASVASHDLQEPLRKIQAFGDRLHLECAKTLSGAGQDYVRRMLAASQRMRQLIDDLLAFSRVSSKGQPFYPVDLNRVAHEVLDDLDQRLKETHGTVELAALPTIAADALQMRQLFQNLLGNALKFHRPGVPPVVQMGVQLEDGVCTISIRDNGIGFDPGYSDRIFQLFQRLHGRDKYDGTGIGLALCQKIVERHGGRIAARGQPGVGAEFTFSLPIDQAQIEIKEAS